MKSFDGRVAAVTGAASGMGRYLGVRLAKRGCHVALSDVNEEGLEESARLARAHGVKVTTQKLDVANREAVHAWADQVVRDHGKCNAIFNNAGVGYGATAEGFDYSDMEWIFGINYWGVVYGTKAFLPYLRASGEGHVVNTSSLFGLMAFPGQSSYNATKFAVRGFTEALRIELEITNAPVSATCVHPGGIKTNIARAARLHSSIEDLGVKNDGKSAERFERMFRMTAEDAAETIIRGVLKNERRVLVGTDAKLYDALQRFVPGKYQWVLAKAAKRFAS
ncbi:MAG: SDR family NAD(P)-dependent oxidoreductase [Deltaproteobacteria bacterium]|nr:SDR family NAD(P)-dependent oxidoreductase [Deltaproteobacteria bacterium]